MKFFRKLTIALLVICIVGILSASYLRLQPAVSIAADRDVPSVAQPIGETLTPNTPVPTTEKEPEPEKDVIRTCTMGFVGDLMVHQWQLDDAYQPATDSYNFQYSFEKMVPYLQAPNFMIGNLETVFASKEVGYSDYPMFNTPDAFGEALKKSGFDFLTTANNHANDKREQGILRTIKVLDDFQLDHTGTYASQADRDQIYMKEINGIRFAILSYTYGTNGIPLTQGKDYLANVMDESLIRSDIQKAKTLPPDFIVVLPHMGNEYELMPKETFKNWVHMMMEAGADIVMASHPHVLQPAEWVTIEENGTKRKCFAVYSMGNFISSQRTVPRDMGILWNLRFEKKNDEKATIQSVSFVPTWVQFVNDKGEYDIRVLAVTDALQDALDQNTLHLRPKDITRLKEVQAYVSSLYLNEEVPIESLQREYYIPLV